MSNTKKLGEVSETSRGFGSVQFKDEYGLSCSIQESSRAVCENEDGSVDDPLGWIWLGIDNANPEIMKSDARKLGFPDAQGNGWMPFEIPNEVLMHTRMHLSETQVKGLIERLTDWLESGRVG